MRHHLYAPAAPGFHNHSATAQCLLILKTFSFIIHFSTDGLPGPKSLRLQIGSKRLSSLNSPLQRQVLKGITASESQTSACHRQQKPFWRSSHKPAAP